MKKNKSENKQLNAEQKNGLRKKKNWHNTDPPQQLHWFRIILGTLDTESPH